MSHSACVKTILILAAIPHGLRLDKEIRSIEEAIRRAAKRDLFKITLKTAVRPQDIRHAIAEEQPQIVHFCGHGLEDGSLMLEDDGGENKPVPVSGLASLFQLHADYVECVLLNACHSAKLAIAISEYINYAIGMNQPIGDKAAIAFAQGFYDGLGYATSDNLDVFQRAFEEGKVAIQLEHLSESQIPVINTKTKDKPLGKRPTTESSEHKKIILFVAVHPVDTMSSRLDEEVQEIENALKRTKQREQFKLEVLRPVRLRDIRDALLEHAPQIVHFSGHGIKTEGFAIADDVGEIKLVTTDELKKLFRNFSTIECVVLNVGFSERQSNAIVQHINYVIYLSQAIGHKTAIEFTKAFYARLGAERSIEDSYNYGCDSINSYQNVSKNFIPVIKKKTKPENLTDYFIKATEIIISQDGRNHDQLSQPGRDSLEQCRLRLRLLEEEAFDIENYIFQLLNNFERDIKARIEKYKNHINNIKIDDFTVKFRQELSIFQNYIGFGEEAIDKTDTRIGDKIISIIYAEVAEDLLCQEQLSLAEVFLKEAAKFDEYNVLAYQGLASIYFEEEKYTKALVELKEVKKILLVKLKEAKENFEKEEILEDIKKIDLFINRIPISSRIIHLIGTVLQMFVT
ncbi:CHAT domain-containing tetratricopeptide repeat protein [Iningainema tapete]|nr:CHAT domain-containing protein [Iningainema tapete]